MNHLIKLGLAAALGAGAVILNLWWLNSRPKDPEFVSINKSLEEGKEITSKDLAPIAIPGKVDELKKTFVPWDDQAVIYNRRAIRDYKQGDLFLQRDVQGGPPHYDVLGPFKIVSVCEQAAPANPDERKIETESSGNSNTVTVLVRHYFDEHNHYQFDEKTRRLMQFIQGGEGGGSSRTRQKIVTIQVYPKDSKSPPDAPPNIKDFNEVRLIVPLNDVEIVKKALAVGNEIGFVVPTRL